MDIKQIWIDPTIEDPVFHLAPGKGRIGPYVLDGTLNEAVVLGKIREAVGDPYGKLMQDELVELIRDLHEAVKYLDDKDDYDEDEADRQIERGLEEL